MGLSPYDRKSYRESKRRRRQAMRQSETGYIKPYRRRFKKRMIIICVSAVLCAACAAAVITVITISKNETVKQESLLAIGAEERLRVVSKADPLPESFTPELVEFRGVRVHAAIADELERMFSQAEEQGIDLKLTCGYIPFSEQEKLYERNLSGFLKNPDYTPVRAQAAAQRIVPEAGCSEYQTGLLVDFDMSDPRAKAFVERECIDYGFIQRYAENKEDQTHMKASVSAYRYVGKSDAEKMRAFDMCLEEYDDYIYSQSFFTVS